VFDRDSGLTNELIVNVFSFFSAKQSARIATTSTLFNVHHQTRINDLIKKVEKMHLGSNVLRELENRCYLYENNNSYYMHIKATDFNLNSNNLSDKSILEHDVIKQLRKLKNCDLYFYSPNGNEFYDMDSRGLAGKYGKENFYYTSFFTHETNRRQEPCKLYVDVDSGYANLLKSNFMVPAPLRKMTNNDDVLATYRLVHPTERRVVLMQLLTNESQLIPLRYREVPEHLFRCSDTMQYILITNSGSGYTYKVLMGYSDNWQEIPVTKVECLLDGGTTTFMLNPESGYQSLYSPFKPRGLQSTLILANGSSLELEVLDHSKFDYASIGITIGAPNPRPTLLDSLKAKEHDTNIALLKC
jgi:hypothetical protein